MNKHTLLIACLFLASLFPFTYPLESSTITIYNQSSGAVMVEMGYAKTMPARQRRAPRALLPDETPGAYSTLATTIEAGQTHTVNSSIETGKDLISISLKRQTTLEPTKFNADELRAKERIIVTDDAITIHGAQE